jgi:hypothetical protein
MKNAFLTFVLASLTTTGLAAETESKVTNGRTFREVIVQGEPDQTVSITLATSFETVDSCNEFFFSLEAQTSPGSKFTVADLHVSHTKMLCRTLVAPYKKTVSKPLDLLLNANGYARLLVPTDINVRRC